MRSSLLVAVAVALGFVAVTPGNAAAHPSRGDKDRPTVFEVLLQQPGDGKTFDHRWYDYDIFRVLLRTFQYDDLFEGEVTVFAPKDYAFFRLAKQAGAPPMNEADTLDWLFANLGAGPMEDTLGMHVHEGTLSYRQLRRMDGEIIHTYGEIEIDVRRRGPVTLVDQDADDRDPTIIKPNIEGRLQNGYIHGIDRVIRPFDLP